MLEIILCDDNPKCLNGYAAILEKALKRHQMNGRIVCKADNPQMVEDYIRRNSANVFFLDIDLKSSDTGYTLAKKIREHNPKAYIVFITGHLEYVLQAFKIRVFDFLPKPVSEEVLEQCLVNIYSDHTADADLPPSDDSIEIKSGSSIYRIKKKDIVYLEKVSHKTIIHLVNSMISCCETLEQFEKLLSDDNFIRCHKSFIANKSYISEIRMSKNEILFETGQVCYIGRTYKKHLQTKL